MIASRRIGVFLAAIGAAAGMATARVSAQVPAPTARPQTVAAPTAAGAENSTAATVTTDTYVIGPEDVLSITLRGDKDIDGRDITVRPDGRITLPFINEIQAAGLTPDALRQGLTAAALAFYEQPSFTVVVKESKSRKVYITGEVAKPATYLLTSRITVLQLIAMAGGLTEYAKAQDIAIIRVEANGETKRYAVHYTDIIKGNRLKENLVLMPGDTVVVPD